MDRGVREAAFWGQVTGRGGCCGDMTHGHDRGTGHTDTTHRHDTQTGQTHKTHGHDTSIASPGPSQRRVGGVVTGRALYANES